MTDLEIAWTALLREGRQETGWHVRRVKQHAALAIYGALHQPGHRRGLIIECAVEVVPSSIQLPQTKGLSISTELLGAGPDAVVRFILTTNEGAYEDVFAVLCEDVSDAAARAADARSGMHEWLCKLQSWVDFLARYGAEGLSEEEVVGLVGELAALEMLLIPRIGPQRAILAWSGPRGEPNDFEFASGFLEIKTTAKQSADVIHISNLEQLNDKRGSIILAFVRLRADASGRSLPDMVAGIRALTAIPPEALHTFNALIASAGYLDLHARLYPRRWSVSRIDFFAVCGDFPRIRADDVRAGVQAATYSISIEACSGFAVDGSVFDRLLEKM